jgi:hypothetical protein
METQAGTGISQETGKDVQKAAAAAIPPQRHMHSCERRGGAHQAQQAVCVEHKVSVVGGVVADDCVHAADLEVGGDDLQVWVDAAQVVLLQLHADVLRDQVNGNHVVAPAGSRKNYRMNERQA